MSQPFRKYISAGLKMGRSWGTPLRLSLHPVSRGDDANVDRGAPP